MQDVPLIQSGGPTECRRWLPTDASDLAQSQSLLDPSVGLDSAKDLVGEEEGGKEANSAHG